MIKVSGEVEGKVQQIMFRQTFIRGLLRRNLVGGATNLENKNRVRFSIEGPEESIKEVIDCLTGIEKLNSWGAHVKKVFILDDYINYQEHQVTTDNVDDFNWSEGVEFYL